MYLEGLLAGSEIPFRKTTDFNYLNDTFLWSPLPPATNPAITMSSTTSDSNALPHRWLTTHPSRANQSSSISAFLSTFHGRSLKGCTPCEEWKFRCDLEGIAGDPPCKNCTASGLECFFGDRERKPGSRISAPYHVCESCKRRNVECTPSFVPESRSCLQCLLAGLFCEIAPKSDNILAFGDRLL